MGPGIGLLLGNLSLVACLPQLTHCLGTGSCPNHILFFLVDCSKWSIAAVICSKGDDMGHTHQRTMRKRSSPNTQSILTARAGLVSPSLGLRTPPFQEIHFPCGKPRSPQRDLVGRRVLFASGTFRKDNLSIKAGWTAVGP